MPRASGKTTLLIEESAKSQKPIIVGSEFAVQCIIDQAYEMGEHIPEPINVSKYMNNWNYRHDVDRGMNRYSGLLIDDLDYVLKQIFRKPIDKVTYTPENIDTVKTTKSKYSFDDFMEFCDRCDATLNDVYKRIDRLSEDMDKEQEEKKMSKFKVGDIVRVKPKDEMWKSKKMLCFMEKFADTYHRITTVHIFTDETLYILEDCNGCYFDESMLEDRTYTKDDIFNINVIVPDKVVEIEFYDGKEKMVCHEDDTFDLRKCCFIAIAKHLYKKEYTQEGIEHMATQLTYQKKYVKIVDKALKDYKKKEKEKAEKIRKEEEEKIIRARQNLKRWRQKERRKKRQEMEENVALQSERAEMVRIIADAINEAKARRKANKF